MKKGGSKDQQQVDETPPPHDSLEYSHILVDTFKAVQRDGAIRESVITRVELVDPRSVAWAEGDENRPGLLRTKLASKRPPFCVCVCVYGQGTQGVLLRSSKDGQRALALLMPALASEVTAMCTAPFKHRGPPYLSQPTDGWYESSETGRIHRQIWGAFMSHPDREAVDRDANATGRGGWSGPPPVPNPQRSGGWPW